MSMPEELWLEIGRLEDVPLRGSRVVSTERGDIAVFRTADGTVFALWDKCPHKGGPLSQGIVHGHSVTCPLHNWVIGLETGEVQGPDKGCARKVAVRLQDDRILILASRHAEPRAA
jgi:nitrite reductase (NADH) small subunit